MTLLSRETLSRERSYQQFHETNKDLSQQVSDRAPARRISLAPGRKVVAKACGADQVGRRNAVINQR